MIDISWTAIFVRAPLPKAGAFLVLLGLVFPLVILGYRAQGRYVMMYRAMHHVYIPWTFFERMDALANRKGSDGDPVLILFERQMDKDIERTRWQALALLLGGGFLWVGGAIVIFSS